MEHFSQLLVAGFQKGVFKGHYSQFSVEMLKTGVGGLQRSQL
jgi:hypothetical protein